MKRLYTLTASPSRVNDGKLRRIRFLAWTVALCYGATGAWVTRHSMNPDGVSYLDIGDAYWRGDWHNAINAYWSPLYSWILGFFVRLLRPSAYSEYPVVHLVNFLIYATALACFEYLLNRIIEQRRYEQPPDSETDFPDGSLRLLGYAVFISCSLILIGLGPVTPDMCVLALLCLVSGLILKIQAGLASGGTHAALGVILGLAYLAKSVMFPLAFVFLIVAFAAGGLCQSSLRRSGVAALFFLLLALPFIAAISGVKGRLTFGDSGRLNYAVCVTGDDWYIPVSQNFNHPVQIGSGSPLIHTFPSPISGTYPLWYDLSYWHEGASIHFKWRSQVAAILEGMRRYGLILFNTFRQLNFTLVLLILFALSPSLRSLQKAFHLWPLWIPAMAGIMVYALVVVEYRYAAPFLLLLWTALFSAMELPSAARHSRLLVTIVAGAVATTLVLGAMWVWLSRTPEGMQYPVAASAIRSLGLNANARVAVIGSDPAGRDGAYVARLGRMKIIAELRDPAAFWSAHTDVRERVATVFCHAGAQVILGYQIPQPAEGWISLGNSGYSAYWLRKCE